MKFKLISLLLLFVAITDSFAAQVKGMIKDRDTQEQLIGVHVAFINQSTNKKYQVISGLDGSYNLKGLEKGKYDIALSFIGYKTLTEELEIIDPSADLVKNFLMQFDNKMLSEVVVTSDNRGTDTQARALEKKSSNVINIISSKQIELSPDITVANVIQRVSGLSIERNASGDPQYAIVRGMDKRYNNTLVNGIKIPSPDNENRFVPLDIFPAVFLERLEVYKSLTANMEADAIGGTVNMVMKNAPNNFMLDADFQLGYNTMNLDGDFMTYKRSGLNRHSPKEIYGDNYRATPVDFPAENMITRNVAPLPDIFANATYGNRFMNSKLGVMVGGSFQNSYRPVSSYFYDPAVNQNEGNPLIMRELIERETSSQMQRMAFHTKLDYEVNNRHNLSFYFGKYLLNEFRVREQLRRESFVIENNYAVYPITRTSNIFQDITTSDLGGRHKLLETLDLTWHAVYSFAKNDLPDDGVFARAGTFNTERREVMNEIVYFQGTRNSRAWERNQDKDLSLYADFTYKPYFFNKGSELQFGGVVRNKVRDNYYNYYNYAQIFGQFRGEDWDDFGDVRFNAMANPLGSGDNSNLVYDATERINAAYINSHWNLKSVELKLGVRMEHTQQSYEINELSASGSGTETSKTQEYIHLFPSVSFKKEINSKAFMKATYYKGISRPGFYEIVPTIRSAGGGDSFYSERGNADLRPSIGHSADLRYEIFPSMVDQVFVGVFFKRIIDPIEYGFPQVENVDTRPNTSRILPQNFDDATNFGLEADYTKYFNKLGIRANYTFTKSEITTNKIIVEQEGTFSLASQTRPLQGQSDHIANFSVLWKDQKNLLDMQLVLNYTGERIAFVSPYFEADHYMSPMVQLDFSLEKGFKNKLVCFVKANNLLDTPYQLYVKKPLAFPEDPYPYQTDANNIGLVKRDLYGRSVRLGVRYSFN